ncbi:Sec-independent protein translocase subunit TatA [Streptosporangium sp. NPDC051022]|uniref:Sec-independent protein translocase subunit TatA n=1 Tax=Streptosporangium sp. NPDC051022 TaxID=3155752 RepID=UPI00343972EC
MGSLSPMHWLIVVAAAALLFGAKKLPDTARSVGRSLRIFKAEVSQVNQEPERRSEITPTPVTVEEQARRLEEEAARLRAQAAAVQDAPAKDTPKS